VNTDHNGYQDRILRCRDFEGEGHGAEFLFTAGQQAHWARLGFSDPIRCARHRAIRKAQKVHRESVPETRPVRHARRPLIVNYD